MKVKDIRKVYDAWSRIEVVDADSCVTLACADEAQRLIDEYDDYEVDLLIAAVHLGVDLALAVLRPAADKTIDSIYA